MILVPNHSPASILPLLHSELAKMILVQKQRSSTLYRYDSVQDLLFELGMRVRIVKTARALNSSGAQFATFEKSKCNPGYWQLTRKGGFLLKGGVKPAEAVRDIFMEGHLYAFECAVAIVIVLYKAVLETIGEDLFNTMFSNLLLWSWHSDSDLRLIQAESAESFPGDVLYFDNPDVSPETPEYQGENVVKMENNLYYGHGIGITTAEEMIAALNRYRKPGSQRSAFLLDQVTFPDFHYFQRIAETGSAAHIRFDRSRFPQAFWTASIGNRAYVGGYDMPYFGH